jgi:hypothetical protein
MTVFCHDLRSLNQLARWFPHQELWITLHRQVKQSRDFDIPKRYGMHLFTSVCFFTLFKRCIYPQMAAEGCA